MEIRGQKIKIMKLSNQALGSLMMALQRAILKQEDITEKLKEFELVDTKEGLWIKNPPMVKFDFTEEYEDEDNQPTEKNIS